MYDRVRQVNRQIQALSPVFARSKVQWVRHTGSSLPAGTIRFEPRPPIESLTTQGTGAVVSRLTNGNRQYLFIVNRDIHNSMSVSVRFSQGIAVSRIATDGTERKLETPSCTADVDAGDALLFAWSEA